MERQHHQVIGDVRRFCMFLGDWRSLEHMDAPGWALLQVKGAVNRCREMVIQLRRAPCCRIVELKCYVWIRLVARHWFAEWRSECRTQHWMALGQPSKGAMQGIQIGVPRNGGCPSEVISDRPGSHFVEKPQGPLAVRLRVLLKIRGGRCSIRASRIHSFNRLCPEDPSPRRFHQSWFRTICQSNQSPAANAVARPDEYASPLAVYPVYRSR